MKKIAYLIGLVALLSSVALADATANLTPSVTITNNCTITGNPISFGAYDPIGGAAVQHNTTISVACTNGMTAPKVKMDQGLHPTGSSTLAAPLRQLSDGGSGSTHNLTYNIYSNSGYTTVWEGSTGVISPTPSGSAQTMNVYGQIDSGQSTAVAGTFSDTVVVTVVF